MIASVFFLRGVLRECDVLQRPEVPVGDFAVEVLCDLLHVERIVVPLLNRERRQGEQVLADRLQIEHLHAFGGGAESFAGTHSDAAKQPALVGFLVVFDVQEMPVGAALVGKHKKGIGMFPRETVDDRALMTAQERVGFETAVDNVESVVLAAGGKQDRVFRERLSGALRPLPGAEGTVLALVVEFLPEEPFQPVQVAQVLKDGQNRILSVNCRHVVSLGCFASGTFLRSLPAAAACRRRLAASDPCIYFCPVELPEASDLVGRQRLLSNPRVNCLLLHAEMLGDLNHGQPTFFLIHALPHAGCGRASVGHPCTPRDRDRQGQSAARFV